MTRVAAHPGMFVQSMAFIDALTPAVTATAEAQGRKSRFTGRSLTTPHGEWQG